MFRADETDVDQALRIAKLAGVADAESRIEPEVTATIRFGDPPLYNLMQRQARQEVVEEALIKLESANVVDADQAPVVSVQELQGVGPDLAAKLEAHGFGTIEALAEAEVEDLKAVPGVGDAKANELKEAAGHAQTSEA